MNKNPDSFIICNISVTYPKSRIFDIFQQKKICVIESIQFVLSDETYDYACVYVAKWYSGKLSGRFIETLQTRQYVELIDYNNYIWKIVSMPSIIQNRPKWFHTCSNNDDTNSRAVIKIRSKPNNSELSYCTDSDSSDRNNDTNSDTISISETDNSYKFDSELDSSDIDEIINDLLKKD
jgi:hypothetical protein